MAHSQPTVRGLRNPTSHLLPRPEFEIASTRAEVIDERTGALLPGAVEELLEVSSQGVVQSVGHLHGYKPLLSLAADNIWANYQDDNFNRKARQSVRYAMLQERHAELILSRIRRQYSDERAVQQLREFISIQYNLAIDVTKRSAVAFRSGMRREIEGISKEEAKAFATIVSETEIATKASAWNRESFLVGPLTEYAVLRGKKMRIESQLPQNYDVVLDPDDPDGTPLAIAYPWRRSMTGNRAAILTVILDGHSWRVFDVQSKQVVPGRETVHGLGHFPGHTLRTEPVSDGDWWAANRHQRLVDGTIRVSVNDTSLDWTRKTQSKKLMVVKGELEEVASQQVGSPERPIEMQTRDPGGIDVQVFDFNIDPKFAHDQINRTISVTLEAYDIKAVDRSENSENDREMSALSDKALTERRSEQVPPARAWDRAIMRNTLEMALKMGHPLKDELPSLEQFDEGYTADFGLVSRSFADPAQQIAWDDKQVARGHASNVSLMMDQNPGLPEDKAEERVLRHMKAQTRFNDLAARRDMPLAQPGNVPTPEDGEDGVAQTTPSDATMTASEINGREGPQARMDSQAQKVDA